jgi:DNA-binding response OmpR family regulator
MAARPIPAIVITGFREAGVEADARRLGAEYLVKPVSPDALRNLIAQMLTARESHRDIRRARRAPRTVLMRRISVRVGPYLGHVVQVSATGVRLEVHGSRETEPPDALALQLGPLGATVPITMAWKRHTARTWICGAAITQEGQAEWRAFLATL